MPISLTIKQADGEERRVDFAHSRVTIGSAPRCDVAVIHAGPAAEQCVIEQRKDGTTEVRDLGESGGVLINGTPVGSAAIGPGDEIRVGGIVMRLVSGGQQGVSFTESVATVREEMAAKAPAAGEPPGDRFGLLDKVQRLISSIGTSENIFEAILDTLFDTVPVRRGFIAIRDDQGGVQVKAHRSREIGAAAGEPIEVSRTLVGKVLETGKAVLTNDAETDEDFSAARSIHRLRIKAAICVPLLLHGGVIGLVYGDNRQQPDSLGRDHLSILSALASVAAVAVEKFRLLDEYEAKLRIEQALAIAGDIQQSFLPEAAPQIENLDVFGRLDSCDETGGDYYDFFPMPDGSWCIVVADVSGHGVGPALLMATLRGALRVLIQSEPSLDRLMHELNNLIAADVRDGRFITLFLGNIDPRKRTFLPIGAGHTPPIWCRARDRSTHLIMSGAPPLGILRDLEFTPGPKLALGAGDALLFTTDGIMEAENPSGEQFGMERLRAVAAGHTGRSAEALVEAVCAAVEAFTEGQPPRDDATLVAVVCR